MTPKEKLKHFCNRLKALWNRQPDIENVIVEILNRKKIIPMVMPKAEPFKLEGLILDSDSKFRVLKKSGNSFHVTFKPSWIKFLPEGVGYSALFQTQGKMGLIFVGDQSG